MTDLLELEGTIFEQGYGLIAKTVMRDKTLPAGPKALYAYLASYTGKGNPTCFPSMKTICNELRINKDTYSKYLQALIDAGYAEKSIKYIGKGTKRIFILKIGTPKKQDSENFGTPKNSEYNNNNIIKQQEQEDATEKETTKFVFSCAHFKITKEQHETFKKAYPDVRLDREYAEAAAWLISNPGKRQGTLRFVNNWLNRKQDRADFKKSKQDDRKEDFKW